MRNEAGYAHKCLFLEIPMAGYLPMGGWIYIVGGGEPLEIIGFYAGEDFREIKLEAER